MKIIDFIIFLLGTAGLTFIIVESKIMAPIREGLGWDVLKCSLCTGFWVSWIMALLVIFEMHFIPMLFAGALMSYIIHHIVIRL